MTIDYLLRIFDDREQIIAAAKRVEFMDGLDGCSHAELPVADALRTVLLALAVRESKEESYWDAVIMIQQIIDAQ